MTEPSELKYTIQTLIEDVQRRNAEIANFRGLELESLARYTQLRQRLRISAYRLKELSPADYHELFDAHPDILDYNPVPGVLQSLEIYNATRNAEQQQEQKEPKFFCNGINFQ